MLRRFSINGRSLAADVSPRYEKFWKLFGEKRWEPTTFEVFDRCLTPKSHYVDVGAWIGPTLLYAAHIARRCTAFEPDPVAYCALEKNLSHNPGLAERCSVHHAALAENDGLIPMIAPDGAGKSETSCLLPNGQGSFEAKAFDAARLFRERLADADFIKMDIEGGEYDVIPAMSEFIRDRRPQVLLSLHPGHLPAVGRDPLSESQRLLDSFAGYSETMRVGRDAIAPAEDVTAHLNGIPLKTPLEGALLFLP